MDPSLVIEIISTLLAIVGIVFGYRSYKDQSKTKIYYFRKQFIQLYDDVVKNIPGLAITYQGKSIQKKMFIVKAAFLCSGRKDVTSSDIEKGLILELKGENAQWHSFQITGVNANLAYDIENSDPSKLIITPKLLKDKDYFVFEALGESDEANFYIDHRIANVQKKVIVNKIGIEKALLGWVAFFSIFSLILFWLLSKGLAQITTIYSHRSVFFDRNQHQIDQFSAIDTVSFYSHFKLVERPVSPSVYDSIGKKYPKSMNPEIRHLLMSIDSFRVKDTMIEEKTPNVDYAWRYNDSVSKIADSEYSKSKVNFLFLGKTRQYRLSPNYSVEYRLQLNFSDVLIELIIPLALGLASIVLAIMFSIKYFQYREVASLANSLLKD